MIEIVAGLPKLRDVDWDGRPEIYVRRQTLLDPYRAPVSVSHLDVYVYDAANSTLVLRVTAPTRPGQQLRTIGELLAFA